MCNKTFKIEILEKFKQNFLILIVFRCNVFFYFCRRENLYQKIMNIGKYNLKCMQFCFNKKISQQFR